LSAHGLGERPVPALERKGARGVAFAELRAEARGREEELRALGHARPQRPEERPRLVEREVVDEALRVGEVQPRGQMPLAEIARVDLEILQRKNRLERRGTEERALAGARVDGERGEPEGGEAEGL